MSVSRIGTYLTLLRVEIPAFHLSAQLRHLLVSVGLIYERKRINHPECHLLFAINTRDLAVFTNPSRTKKISLRMNPRLTTDGC